MSLRKMEKHWSKVFKCKSICHSNHRYQRWVHSHSKHCSLLCNVLFFLAFLQDFHIIFRWRHFNYDMPRCNFIHNYPVWNSLCFGSFNKFGDFLANIFSNYFLPHRLSPLFLKLPLMSYWSTTENSGFKVQRKSTILRFINIKYVIPWFHIQWSSKPVLCWQLSLENGDFVLSSEPE